MLSRPRCVRWMVSKYIERPATEKCIEPLRARLKRSWSVHQSMLVVVRHHRFESKSSDHSPSQMPNMPTKQRQKENIREHANINRLAATHSRAKHILHAISLGVSVSGINERRNACFVRNRICHERHQWKFKNHKNDKYQWPGSSHLQLTRRLVHSPASSCSLSSMKCHF